MEKMDTEKSLEIIRALSNGLDPYTGEEYPADSPYQQAETVRALFMAKEALERNSKSDNLLRNLPGNAGKAWESAEDQRLITGYDAGKSITEIAEEHQRTELAISKRLIKLGRIKI